MGWGINVICVSGYGTIVIFVSSMLIKSIDFDFMNFVLIAFSANLTRFS